MPRALLPAVYREASAILIENPEDFKSGFFTHFCCGAIEQALINRNEDKKGYDRFQLIVKKYVDFMFQVYCPEKIKCSSYAAIWGVVAKDEDVNPRKFALLFLANLLDSGVTPKDFSEPQTIPF